MSVDIVCEFFALQEFAIPEVSYDTDQGQN